MSFFPEPSSARSQVATVSTAVTRHLKAASIGAILIAAVVFSILAVRAPGEGTPVLVAKENILAGQPVDSRLVQIVAVPSGALPDGSLNSPEQLGDAVATRDIPARTVLTATLLSPYQLIPSGYSQIVVSGDTQTMTVAGGDTVHIWGSSESCSEFSCDIELLASHAKIIAVQPADQGLIDTGGTPTITLAIPSGSVSSVLRADSAGSIHFVVPSATDSKLGFVQSGPPSE